MANTKEIKILAYISRHNLVTDEVFEMVKKTFEDYGCKVSFFERGTSYSNLPIIEGDLLIVLPWWDDFKYKLGKGTLTELNVAIQSNSSVMFYCAPDGQYRELNEIKEIPSDDWKYVANVFLNDEIDLKFALDLILEVIKKEGRPEPKKDPGNEDILPVL